MTICNFKFLNCKSLKLRSILTLDFGNVEQKVHSINTLLSLKIILITKGNDWIRKDVTYIYLFSTFNNFWMLLHHQPTNV